MNKLEPARATAYEHLQAFIDDGACKNIFNRDYHIVYNLLDKAGEQYSKSTAIQKQAAGILKVILDIEATNETSESSEIFDGEKLSLILDKKLNHELNNLKRVIRGDLPTEFVIHKLNPNSKKIDRQIEAILKVISKESFNPQALPYGSKAKIKAECLDDSSLFTLHSFDHAWKEGSKRDLFKMANSEDYSKGRAKNPSTK